MARISMRGPGTVAEISALLKERIPESGFTCDLIDSASRNGADMLVFEKYFFRAGNCASLSVMITEENGSVIVDSVGAGAREGFLDFTWGAEEGFALEVQNVLEPLGFAVFETDSDYSETANCEPAEPLEPVALGELMNRSRTATRREETAAEDAEYVQLGKEEKKGLFGRKRNKPDWEY
ncbi:MAG: hypothetical protein IKC02_06515 [Oscillospiraceae bacterium]|nr:hypothetical protein [Oscillospiraceae bacterium]